MKTIKMNQSEMKDTLTKMKNSVQGINSRVDKAKNQISDLEYKEAKNTLLEQEEEKTIPTKMMMVEGASGTTSSIPTFTSRGCQKEKRASKKLKTHLKK